MRKFTPRQPIFHKPLDITEYVRRAIEKSERDTREILEWQRNNPKMDKSRLTVWTGKSPNKRYGLFFDVAGNLHIEWPILEEIAAGLECQSRDIALAMLVLRAADRLQPL